MKTIGTYLVFFGIAAILLDFFNAVPRVLAWIYNWGDGAAWGIKIAFVIVGVILYFLGSRNTDEVES